METLRSLFPGLAILACGACATFGQPSAKQIEDGNRYFQTGLSFYEDRSYPESLQALEQAAILVPKQPNIEMYRALALYHVGREPQGIALMRRTCLLQSEFPACYSHLASLLLHSKDYAGALDAANHALASPTFDDPDTARSTRGLALHFLGRDAEAVEAFNSVQDRSSLNLRCRLSLLVGRSQLAQANFSEATRQARIAGELCENEPRAQLWMAYVAYRTAKIDEAKHILTEAVKSLKKPELRDEARMALERLNREQLLKEPALF